MPSVAVICTVHIRLDETVYLLSAGGCVAITEDEDGADDIVV